MRLLQSSGNCQRCSTLSEPVQVFEGDGTDPNGGRGKSDVIHYISVEIEMERADGSFISKFLGSAASCDVKALINNGQVVGKQRANRTGWQEIHVSDTEGNFHRIEAGWVKEHSGDLDDEGNELISHATIVAGRITKV